MLTCGVDLFSDAALQGLMDSVMDIHNGLIRAAAARHAGYEVGTEGGECPDAACCRGMPNCLAAALLQMHSSSAFGRLKMLCFLQQRCSRWVR